MQAQVGVQYSGRVADMTPKLVTVELASGELARLHVTRILPRGVRLLSAADVLSVGDAVRVTVAEIDERRGLIGLNLDAKLGPDGEVTPQELVDRRPS